MSENLIDCVAAKAFTSTQFGNLDQGDPINGISQKRFNVWKEQGLVKAKPQKAPAPVEAPAPTPAAPAPKVKGKRKGKNRK